MHHPLTRQPTLDSIRSWWSDRNPPGPNINLHAAAKPLMRLMYHRDAVAFIAKNRGTSLSGKNMEIYSSYLAYKYVSPATKTAIVEELGQKAISEEDARAVVDSPALQLLQQLLGSPDAKLRRSTCSLLGKLVYHQSTAAAVLRVNPCVGLVPILSGTDIELLESTMYVLSLITQSPEGAQAAVAAKAVDYLEDPLASPNMQVRSHTCATLGHLAFYDSTSVNMKLCPRLVPLLRDTNLDIVQKAAEALFCIAKSPEGAQAAVDAHVLDYVADLLLSPNAGVRQWTCKLLVRLASNKSTVTAIVGVRTHCLRLVSLLGYV
ncbi:armadillo-type protein [Mycena latifolia]|nr:armadillo-type protein [Mycena latifolia]